jgi:hypothetical protein
MQFIQDAPIAEERDDALGLGDFVQTIERGLRGTQAPFVFGVIGDWGCGKTSVMKLLCARMDNGLRSHEARVGESVFVPIWFDAWLYENEASVVYPLLHAIQKDFNHRLGEQPAVELKKRFGRVVKGTFVALADLGLRATTQFFVGERLTLKDAKDALELAQNDESVAVLEKVMRKWADEVGELKSAFEALLTCYAEELAPTLGAKADSIRFVICVDDLDRCLPQTVIQILESIKNFLSVRNTIFVLGMNAKIVAQGIRSKYPDQEIDGREYLEKIINYSFYVPAPELSRLERFCRDLLRTLVKDDETLDDASRERFFSEFATVLRDGRFNNPRKIKRILNRYLLYLAKHGKGLDSSAHKNVVRLLVIAEYFPQLFSLFLYSAQEVMADLYNGGKGVKVDEFEATWRVPIGSIYRQLIVMKDLFRKVDDPRAADLSSHVAAVFAITHSL